MHQFDKDLFVKIFQNGWPIGLQWTAETALLNVSAWLAGYLGTATLAAHQIAIQAAEIAMVIPLGIAYAAIARVGQMMGEKNLLGARRAAWIGIAFGGIFASVMALILSLFSEQIVGIYLNINDPDNIVVFKRATSFIALASLFQIFYSIQTVTLGSLVGLQDTFVPVLMSLAGWSIGLGGSYFMGIILGWGGIGIWLAMVLSPLFSAVTLIARFSLVIANKIASSEDAKERVVLPEMNEMVN